MGLLAPTITCMLSDVAFRCLLVTVGAVLMKPARCLCLRFAVGVLHILTMLFDRNGNV